MVPKLPPLPAALRYSNGPPATERLRDGAGMVPVAAATAHADESLGRRALSGAPHA